MVTFLVTFVCGTAIAYSFMLLLTSISVWMVRNQSLMEMWWLFSSVARYPKEIFAGRWAEPLGAFFTYIMPILVVVNVPANAMVRALDPPMVGLIMVGGRRLALAQPPLLPAMPCGRIAARAVDNTLLTLLSSTALTWQINHGTRLLDRTPL